MPAAGMMGYIEPAIRRCSSLACAVTVAEVFVSKQIASQLSSAGPSCHLRHRCLGRGLIRATLHLVNREFASLADDFMTLGLLPPGSDKETIVPALTGVFQVRHDAHAPRPAFAARCRALHCRITVH